MPLCSGSRTISIDDITVKDGQNQPGEDRRDDGPSEQEIADVDTALKNASVLKKELKVMKENGEKIWKKRDKQQRNEGYTSKNLPEYLLKYDTARENVRMACSDIDKTWSVPCENCSRSKKEVQSIKEKLEEKENESKQAVQSIRAELEEKENEISSLKVRVASLKKDKEDKNKEMEKLKKRLSGFQEKKDKNEQKERESLMISQQLEKEKHQNKSYEQNLKELEQEKEKMRTEFETEKKRCEEANNNLKELEQEKEKMRTEFETEKKKCEEANNILEDNNKELARQMQTMKTEKDQANKEWEKQRKILVQTEKTLKQQFENERKAYVERENKRLAELKQKSDINDDLNAELQRIQRSLQDKNSAIHKLRAEVQEERKTKDDALLRLSAIASSRLRDQNPNITDLSDENRPTKLGEKMCELYDNEWTDAFDELESQHGEVESIKLLLQILQETYNSCCRNAEQQMEQVIAVISDEPSEKELLKSVKDVRKKRVNVYMEQFKETVDYTTIVGPASNTQALKLYINKCIEYCWIMVVQDPPLCLRESQMYEKFDTKVYREYTQRGPYLQFVVWPTVLLHESGPILVKGVAQGGRNAAPPQDDQIKQEENLNVNETEETGSGTPTASETVNPENDNNGLQDDGRKEHEKSPKEDGEQRSSTSSEEETESGENKDD